MKSIFRTALFLTIIVTFSVIATELFTTNQFRKNVESGKTGFPEGTNTDKMSMADKNYHDLAVIALRNRQDRLNLELARWFCLICIPTTFFVKKIRNTVLELVDVRISLFKRDAYDIKTGELNFISIFITLILYCTYGDIFVTMVLNQENGSLISTALLYILMLSIVLPLLIVIAYNMFRIYENKFIIACYLAFYVKSVMDFMSQDEVNPKVFTKVNSSEFHPKVQEVLKEQSLQNKVYREIVQKDSVNAALVGWGEYEHIEIYGNSAKFSGAEFNSVLMHEIGHSKDFSLYKKIAMLFVLKAVEMVILLIIFSRIADDYSDDSMSKIGSFIVLYFVYETFMSKYLMAFHKLTSQVSETAADIVAKEHGFGKELANVLYRITVDSKEYLYPTFLYNVLQSYHPAVHTRIEYLTSN